MMNSHNPSMSKGYGCLFFDLELLIWKKLTEILWFSIINLYSDISVGEN